MEGSVADAAAEATAMRERRSSRIEVSEEKKKALAEKLAAVRAGQPLAGPGATTTSSPAVPEEVELQMTSGRNAAASDQITRSERRGDGDVEESEQKKARALTLESELRRRLESGELTPEQTKAVQDRLKRSALVRRLENGDDNFDSSEQEQIRSLKFESALRRRVVAGALTSEQFRAAQDRFERSALERHAANGELDGNQAPIEDEQDVQERDQKPVVDWISEPDAEIARVSRLYARPTYVLQTEHPPVEFWLQLGDPDPGLQLSDGGAIARVSTKSMAAANGVTDTHTLVSVGRQRITTDMPAAEIEALIEIRPVRLKFMGGSMDKPKRIVFDRADAKLDGKGWLTETATNGQNPKPYPCCCLDVDELGMIGGVGMRLYFYLLSFLCRAFFVMAVLTTPSIVLMKDDHMYNHTQASRYRTVLAETTLGNVKSPVEELQSGAAFPWVLSNKLWTISTAEALGSLVMLWMALNASKTMARLVDKVDQAAVTMSDYTVLVEPKKPWRTYQSIGKTKYRQLIDDLKAALETIVSEGDIADIDGKPCIWVAWNDRQNIALWEKKRATLIELEAGLFQSRATGNMEASQNVLNELDAVNKQLGDVNAKTEWRPVCAFATYNLAEHYEGALRAKQVEVGGVKCTIRPAPEPESVKWEHLEYSSTQRMCRKFIIYLGTTVALLGGALAILSANSLKVGTSYIDYCADVIGNTSNDELAAACPGVRVDGQWSPGADSDLAALYHNMFKAMHDQYGDLFVAEEGDDGPETVGAHRDDLPFAVCADDERGTPGQPCHYIDTGLDGDTSTQYLLARGDLDAMCYACICTLSSVEETIQTPLENYLADNPTYLDQCYASDSAVTATVDACAAADLSDSANAQDQCVSAAGDGECTYVQSDVQSYCAEMDAVVTEATIWGYVATVIVVVVNQVLKLGIKKSASFARAHTIEEEMVATSMRVYACQLLNTAILMLILRSDFWPFHELPGEHYPTVNAKWYAEVGAPMIQTMIIQFLTPPGVHIFMAIVNRCLACRNAKAASTQNQLNASQQPHSFEVAAGYGEVMLATSVTLIFGSGIPLLYHVAAVGFFIRLNVEKFIVVKVTRKPPLYSKVTNDNRTASVIVRVPVHVDLCKEWIESWEQVLFDSFDELFALLLLAHVAMATYFIASAGGLTPTTTHIYLPEAFGLNHSKISNDKAMHDHISPIFIVFVLVLIGVSSKFLSKLFCCCQESDTKRGTQHHTTVPEAIPSFAEAYTAGLIINDDDDYIMDQYEDLMDLEEAFQTALDAAHDQGHEPFGTLNGDAFYQQTRYAVGAVPGESWGHSSNETKTARGGTGVAMAEAGAVGQRQTSVKAALPWRPPRP